MYPPELPGVLPVFHCGLVACDSPGARKFGVPWGVAECIGDYALVELVQNPIFRLLQVSPVLNARTKQLGTDVTSGLFARTLYDNWMIG